MGMAISQVYRWRGGRQGRGDREGGLSAMGLRGLRDALTEGRENRSAPHQKGLGRFT